MEKPGAIEKVKSGNGSMNARAEIVKLIEEKQIAPAAVARDIAVPASEFYEWLGGGRKPAEFVERITTFLADRTTIRHIMSEVGNELRGNAGSKLAATVAGIVSKIRKASDEEEREEMCDHAMMYIADLKWLLELMARDQTIRSALKPGDRVVIVKSGGGKTLNSHA
jgi:xanthine/CO dehydrogenase XdhC/CoxF family maturation factor